MTRNSILGLALLAALDTSAHILFKVSAIAGAPLEASLVPWFTRVLTAPWVYGAVLCYAATFFVWISLLRRLQVGVAFALSHVDVVTTMAASALLLNERISWSQAAGAGLILAGIACLAGNERAEAAAPS